MEKKLYPICREISSAANGKVLLELGSIAILLTRYYPPPGGTAYSAL